MTIIPKLLALLLGLFLTSTAFAQPALPPLPPGERLDGWGFSDTNLLSIFGYAPISWTNVNFVSTWAGSGLQIDSSNAAWINYALMEPADGWTNLDLTQGTVQMWFSSDWNSSDGIGNWGTLLEAGNWNTNLASATGAWGLYLSPDGSNLYFSAETNGEITNFLNASVAWNAGDWHQIVLTYSATNSSLYLEGALAASGPGVTVWPPPDVLTNGFSIGSDGNGTGMLQARGIFNRVGTFDYPLDAVTISNNYAAESQYVSPLPSSGGFGMDDSGPSFPGFGGGGSPDGGNGGGSYNSPQYGSNDFYIQPLPLGTNAYNSNTNLATLIIHATVNNATNASVYQLWSTTNLAPPVFWGVEQTFLGATNTNFTVVTVSLTNRPTVFFEAVNLGSDPTDSSLPAWYLLQNGLDPTSLYTGTSTVSNPYIDPMGDGWTFETLFQNGMYPWVLYAPPAPTGFTATLNTNGTVSLSWAPAVNYPITGAGAVVGYAIAWNDDNGSNLVLVSGNQTSYTATLADDEFPERGQYSTPIPFLLSTEYENTNSLWASATPISSTKHSVTVSFVRGPHGSIYLVASALPEDVQTVQVHWYTSSDEGSSGDVDLPASGFTNGVCVVPDSQFAVGNYYELSAKAITTNGSLYLAYNASGNYTTYSYQNIPFLDGTTELQQNLAFLLRAAPQSAPFAFLVSPDCSYYTSVYRSWASNYIYSTYHNIYDYDGVPWADTAELRPFGDNQLFSNFVVTTNNVNHDGSLSNGVYFGPLSCDSNNHIVMPYSVDYLDDLDVYLESLLDTLSTNAALNSWQYNYYPSNSFSDIAVSVNDSVSPPLLGLTNHEVNYYGLTYQSDEVAWLTNNNLKFGTLSQGGTFPAYGNNSYHLYPSTVAPVLSTVSYFFGRPGIDPVPGNIAFTATNTTVPLMIASVGQPFTLSAWAKQRIVNGYTNMFGYLEQYFDKAYLGDDIGDITTNQTGVLSEYGEFFPTDPGVVYLTTTTNASGPPGTNAIEVIGLIPDANHDGVLDTRFSGPDFTTPARPFRFWVNDDNDSGDTGGNDIPGAGTNGLSGHVNGVRDLVDFFPVYIDVQSVVDAAPEGQLTNYQFILSQADGALNYVNASLPTNQPLQYLTDTNTAYSLSNATVTQITSNGISFNPSSGSGVILCEASAPTVNPLVLTIMDANSNVLAQTSLYLSITGVEQMFRQKNLVWATYPNRRDGPPDRLADSDVPNEPDTDGNNFVFLHGYNVNASQARGWDAQTFKRMYWSGSHAKFYGVTWLAYDGQLGGVVTPNLQTNIVHAFETAPQLSAFLNALNGTNILAAHSLGNMPILSALNDCGNTNINTFFMIDAAVAIEAIDGSASVNTNMIHPDWTNYTNRLWASDWYQLFATNDHRRGLTWKNRLSNLQNAQVYNFYSSGEEVLRMFPGEPPSTLSGALQSALIAEQNHVPAQDILNFFWPQDVGLPEGVYAWAWEEKMKGLAPFNWLLSSDHGGWRFNTGYNTNYFAGDTYVTALMDPATAASLPDSTLMTNAFFEFTSLDATPDLALLGSGGSAYAQTNLNRIISDAIPALTLPVGANPVASLAPDGQPDRNFDMQLNYENGWPFIRMQQPQETNNWHHSDMREVAYTYTYQLFNKFVTLGNLK